MGAHPRSRGEHVPQTLEHYASSGSSPLARGTRGGLVPCLPAAGLIPARAGNTRRPRPMSAGGGAHPRSRGEHPVDVRGDKCHVGSSPLARGTLHGGGVGSGEVGLIPARAGNTPCCAGLLPRVGAHPRSRGEHLVWCSRRCGPMGSSPLARGTPASWAVVVSATGLIPARAGNTRSLHGLLRWRRAHPRSRGEHLLCVCLLACLLGSSPLARGTLLGGTSKRF